MKLQIEGQKLRIRIDEHELRRLRDGHVLSSVTVLPADAAFRCLLELHPDKDASMTVYADRWQVALPAAAVDAYVARPCRDGLAFPLPTTNTGEPLTLLFDVDVRDSVRQRGAPRRRE